MPKTRVNDIEIYYERHGKGPRLLYLCGTGSDLREKPNIFDAPLQEVQYTRLRSAGDGADG